jgi:hypothetical protein
MLDISEIIDALLRKSKLGRQDLSGFIIDLEHPFENVTELRSFVARETGDKTDMVAVALTTVDGAKSIQQITYLLQHAWAEACFFDFQASSVQIYCDAVIMRFVTADEDDKFLYTGSITVSGGNYDALRKIFERDFYTLPERVR